MSSKISFLDTDYRYGFHISECDTLEDTIKKVATETSYANFQICLGRNLHEYKIEDILSARKILEYYDLYMFIHGSFTYNLCGAPKHRQDPKYNFNVKNTCEGLTMELDIAVGLGCKGVVVHPNSCQDEKKGIFTASKMMENILTRDTKITKELSKKLGLSMTEIKKRRKIIIENSAHEGNKRGWNLDELGRMIKGVPENLREQVGVCSVNAHTYGAGIYDFGIKSSGGIPGIFDFYRDFEKEIGMEYLALFHLNDSKNGGGKANDAYFGSRKDRHEHLGIGYIFGNSVPYLEKYIEIGGKIMWDHRKKSLREFFKQAYLHKIPIIGEPPGTFGGDKYDWKTVCDVLKNTDIPLVYP